jgi:hypothetical protein
LRPKSKHARFTRPAGIFSNTQYSGPAGIFATGSALRGLDSIPAVRVPWRMGREYFSSDYRAFVDTIMRDRKMVLPSNRESMWKTMMAEEMAAIGKPG